MANIDFSQDELKVIFSVFNNTPIKMGDAYLMIPIIEKIRPLIEPDKPVEPVEPVEKVKELKAEELAKN